MRIFCRALWLFRPFLGRALGGIILSLITTLSSIVLMAASGWFITAMGLAGMAGLSMNYYTPAAIIRAMALIRTGSRYAERLVTHEATFQFLSILRRHVFDRLEPLAPAGLEDLHGADVAARLTGDVDRLRDLYLRVVTPVVAGFLGACLCVAFAMAQSPAIGWLLAGGLLITGGGGAWLSWFAGHQAARSSVTRSEALRIYAIDQIQGLGELQAFGADRRAMEDFLSEARGLYRDQARANSLDALVRALSGFTGNLIPLLVLVLVPGMSGGAGGTLDGAWLVLMMFFCLASFETVAPVPAAIRALPEILESARRLFDLIDRPPLQKAGTAVPSFGDFVTLEVENLAFSYEKDGKPLLENFSMRLRPGDHVQLVGPSGAGKSTLISLLTGLRSSTQGRIMLDGWCLDEVDPESWRAAFAVAPQTVQLFTGTLRDNITLGAPDADDMAIREACRIARLEDVLARIPGGLNGYVGEAGKTLSGGEVRRVGLARALLRPAPLLILDEPTEGMDPAMERDFLKSLEEACGKRSLIMISHRQVNSGMIIKRLDGAS